MVPQKIKIPDWPYYLTIEGKVFREGSEKPLTPYRSRYGWCVNLSSNGKRTTYRMNNLVRWLYFGNRGDAIVHLDGCETNWAYWNLKPMTRRGVSKYVGTGASSGKRVIVEYPDGTFDAYASAQKCAEDHFIDASTIRKWCNRKAGNTINENKYFWEEDYFTWTGEVRELRN